MMKRSFAMLGVLFAFSLSVFAGNPGITFLLRSGQRMSFVLAEKPTVVFNDANLSVNVGGRQCVSYGYADVQRVTIDDDVVSTVRNTVTNSKKQHVLFTLSATALIVSGLPANEQLAIYATNGKLVVSVRANAEGGAVVELSALQQGVYVVRTQSGISYKLFKN